MSESKTDEPQPQSFNGNEVVAVLKDPSVADEWLRCGDLADATYEADALEKDNMRSLAKRLGDLAPTPFELKGLIYTRAPSLKNPKEDVAEAKFAGFVAHPRDESLNIYVAWRGTMLKEEWYADAMCDLKDTDWEVPREEGKDVGQKYFHAHTGFWGLYSGAEYYEVTDCTTGQKKDAPEPLDSLLKTGGQPKSVTFTGHSLGGALATLSAFGLTRVEGFEKGVVKLVTFSGPRSSGFKLAYEMERALPNHVRIFTDGDLVPLFPLYLGGGDDQVAAAAKAGTGKKTAAKKTSSSGTMVPEGALDALRGAIEKRFEDFTGKLDDVCFWGEIIQLETGPATKALDTIIKEGKASYHHSGYALNLSTTALPYGVYTQADWNIRKHHSLKLILYLLESDKSKRETRLKEVKDEIIEKKEESTPQASGGGGGSNKRKQGQENQGSTENLSKRPSRGATKGGGGAAAEPTDS